MEHKAVIGRLGGIRSLARKLGHPVHTTVQGWSDRNRIPVEHWGDIVRLAREEELPITGADLMPEAARAA